jgi:hypothetical protein
MTGSEVCDNLTVGRNEERGRGNSDWIAVVPDDGAVRQQGVCMPPVIGTNCPLNDV